MPKISQFYGIIIRMYAEDHNPPHFHAEYESQEAYIDIRTGEIIKGELPRRALRLIQDWAELHQDELLKNWELLQSEKAIDVNKLKIKPLA